MKASKFTEAQRPYHHALSRWRLQPVIVRHSRKTPASGDPRLGLRAHQPRTLPEAGGKSGLRSMRGRSRRLRLNYRTTQEIRVWAVSILEGMSVNDLDEGTDTLKGYVSFLHGAAPDLVRCACGGGTDGTGGLDPRVALGPDPVLGYRRALRAAVCRETSRRSALHGRRRKCGASIRRKWSICSGRLAGQGPRVLRGRNAIPVGHLLPAAGCA